MAVILTDLLMDVETTALRQAVAALDFEPGARTAGRIAQAVKDNEQAVAGPARDGILAKVQNVLLAHPVFQALAIPKGFARLVVSRTSGGGHYGDHIDNALMGGQRADLSFTLFLSDPDSYDGGALTISDRLEDRQFRLNAGELILYASDTLHRVEPVTRGERYVVIGWVTSHIRDLRQREILFDLASAIATAEAAGDTAQVQLLAKSRSNLIRMWAD